ncbi:MAG: nicotinate (nicotinamide) nucleotide adenylyltransferase, partial [Lentisphaeraceae bacterium]|nr:nicotinate (nicotinamide) nucleotide adenylyltransferase [Lentisphaeraceae bacterium]
MRRYTAVFGGTFDPIHNAHIALANAVLEQDLADEIMFTPAARPPHKLQNKITSAEHRMAMLNLVLQENENFALSDYEIVNRQRTSFTINTLRALQAAYPDRRFKLIVGMDNFREMDTWHRFQDILDDFHLIVFTRPGTIRPTFDQIQDKFGPKIARNLDRSIIETVDMNISSTDIRDLARKGEDFREFVTGPVYEYIQQNGIYTQND